MTKLTKLKLGLLQSAADTVDGFIAAPDGDAAAQGVAGLVKAGMMISIPADGQDSRLMITDKGRSALPAHDTGTPAPAAADAQIPQAQETAGPPTAEPPQPKGKIAALVLLLRREQGATIADMMAVTGWQAHSVRGAMSGSVKKGLGLEVSSDKTEAGRVYRITQEVA